MASAADLHARIYQSYNLPYEITPGELLEPSLQQAIDLFALLSIHAIGLFTPKASGIAVVWCPRSNSGMHCHHARAAVPGSQVGVLCHAAGCQSAIVGCLPWAQARCSTRRPSCCSSHAFCSADWLLSCSCLCAGSLLDKAAKLWRKKQARRCALGPLVCRAAVGIGPVPGVRCMELLCLLCCTCKTQVQQGPKPCIRLTQPTPPSALNIHQSPPLPTCRQRALEKKLQREQQRIRRMEAADAAARGDRKPSEPRKEAEAAEPPSDEEDEGGIDDDDLIASTSGVEQQQQQQQQQGQQQQGFAPPSVLASASLGLSRAAVVVQRAFHAAAVRAPPRRCLTRPQRAVQ